MGVPFFRKIRDLHGYLVNNDLYRTIDCIYLLITNSLISFKFLIYPT